MTTGTPWVPSRTRPRQIKSVGSAAPARRTASRALAAMVLLVTVAAIYGLTVSSAFALSADGLAVRGAVYTDGSVVRRALGLDGGARPNLFAFDSRRSVALLRALPAIDAMRADAVLLRVVLPDRLLVDLHERQPIMAWQVGQQRFLVDVQGVLLAETGATAAPPADGSVAPADVSALPVIADSRVAAGGLQLGGRLDAVDLAVARLLGAVTPAMLGSTAAGLQISVNDNEGYVVRPDVGAWRAVFGIYTPHGRGADLVAAQVQCLARLLGGQEDHIAVAYLFPEGERCGTYTRSTDAP